MASPEASAKPVAAKSADPTGLTDENVQTAIDDDPKDIEIAVRAYQLWQGRGCPHGSHQDDWYNAERELKSNGRRYPGVAVS